MLQELFLEKASHNNYQEEVVNILRLIRSENVGPKTFYNLIKFFGDAKTALENIGEYSLRGGSPKPIKVYSQLEAQRELELLTNNNAALIAYTSPLFSHLLTQIPDCPPILCYKGNINLLNNEKIVAIVGARNASANGKFFASNLAKELANSGYVVVSGLARGIDTSVHQVSLNNTIAVIAGGIDHIYPPENTGLYEQIAENGLIIAELPIGTKPLGKHFPQRNRLISGLSLGCIVVEASLKSGSLITARFALEQNREVFAVPGFPLDPRCQGSNKLIKEGAHIVESVNDVIFNLPNYVILKNNIKNFENPHNKFRFADVNQLNKINDSMRSTVKQLLSSMPLDFDCLVEQANLPIPIVHAIIIELELAGKIMRNPGNKISLIYK